MSDSEVIEGTEESQPNNKQLLKYAHFQTAPITLPKLLHILKGLGLLEDDFDVNQCVIELSNQ